MKLTQTNHILYFAFIVCLVPSVLTIIITDSLPINVTKFTRSIAIANIQNTYVSVRFTIRNNPNLTFTIAQASFSGFNNTFPTSQQFFDVNPIDRPQMDLEAVHTGKQQYINLKVSSLVNTVYITVYCLDQFRTQIFFQIEVIDVQPQMTCRPCVSGNLIPNTCTCDPCASGHEGSDCSRRILILQSQNFIRRSLDPATLSYFKILAAEDYIQLTFEAENGEMDVYLNSIKYENQVASYLNVLKSFSTLGRFKVSQGKIFSFIVSLSSQDLAISIANLKTTPMNFNIGFVRKERVDIVIIVLGSLGGLLGLAIVISLTYVAYVFLRRSAIVYVDDQPQQQIISNDNRLTQIQIQTYFPEFTFSQVKEGIEDQGTITNLQSSTCAALQSSEKNINYSGQVDCAICICAIQPNQKTRAVFCKHVFHTNCLISWFKKQRNCPYCREDFSKSHTIQFYQKLKQQNHVGQLKGLNLVKAIMKSGGAISTFKSIPKTIQNLD